MIILSQIIIAGLVMGVLDAIWLTTMYKIVYQPAIGHLLLKSPNLIAAAVFYIFYVVALVYLIINPALKTSFNQLLINSVLFGAICYATYDLTNLATMKDFSLKIAIIDIIWGAVLTAIVSSLTYFIIKKLF